MKTNLATGTRYLLVRGGCADGRRRTPRDRTARRNFLSGHRRFCPASEKEPNYFEYVGGELGELLLKYMKDEPIWFRPDSKVGEPVSK